MFWLVILVADAAASEHAPLLRQEPPAQYPPQGMQIPTAPYPARSNMAVHYRRAQPFDFLPPQDQGSEASGAPGLDVFGPDPTLGHYPEDKGFKSSQTSGYGGQPMEQNIESHLIPRWGILDGPPALRQALNQPKRPPFRPNRPPMRPRERDSGLYPLGLQHNPAGYGQPELTAVGPYSERRLKPMRFSPVTTRMPLAPLRNIESTTKSYKPFESWQGAQRGRGGRNRPHSAELYNPLAPPEMLRSGNNPAQAKLKATHSSDEGVPRVSQEKGYVSPVTRRTYVTRGLLRDLPESTTRPPPALLDDDDGLLEELAPESDDASLFSKERKQLATLSKTHQDAPNTFDNILS